MLIDNILDRIRHIIGKGTDADIARALTAKNKP